MDAAERFAALVDEFADRPGVEGPGASATRKFGSDALKVHGSIFAMVTGGQLVLKLPKDRVAALVGSGVGAPFGTAGRAPMKEWVVILDDDEQTWRPLAREALDFVSARSGR